VSGKRPARPQVTGSVGHVPPPNAPREVNAPLSANDGGAGNLIADTLAAIPGVDPSVIGLSPLEMAQRNERTLAPLTYGAGAAAESADSAAAKQPVAAASVVREVVAAPAVAAAVGAPSRASDRLTDQPSPAVVVVSPAPPSTPALARAPRRNFQSPTAVAPAPTGPPSPVVDVRPVVAATDRAQRPEPAASAPTVQAPKPVVPAGGIAAELHAAVQLRAPQASRSGAAGADQPFHPAASNSDSPSRGIPRASSDPGKQITGGFGDAAATSYFPLNGAELLDVIWVLMDDLAGRLKNDLRFHMATVYPRVQVKAMIVVEGYAEDQNFTIQKVGVPHDRTPLEMAEIMGDEICFVIKAARREFDEAGNSETPPNALRQEIGAPIPMKRAIGSGPNRVIADLES